MSLWSRIANVVRGDRLSREIDEELHAHIEEAIGHGRDPVEARRAFGSTLRRREESRDIRLAVWLDSLRADAVFGWRQLLKKKVDLRRGDSLPGAGDRRLHVGIPADRRAAAAAAAGRGPPAALRAGPPGDRFRRQAADIRRLGVSGIPVDARRGKRPGRVDRDLLRRAHGFDLRVGSGDGKGLCAVCLRLDVRFLRTAARPGAPVHRKRRPEARRASVRGPLL